MEPVTPKRPGNVVVPPSPFLRRLGYGAGVSVFEMVRSPRVGAVRSPWAVKSVLKTHEKRQSVYGKRLLAEADLLRQMNHPNIVGFRQMVKTMDGRSCLAMEKCETSLGTMIEHRKENQLEPFAEKQILKMTLDVAKGLDYIHTKVFLLHGDIKSHNILVNGEFEICKLCDFGVSLPLDSNGVLTSDRTQDDYIGTYCWVAPEVLSEGGVISSKSDIFSFGLTVWEMMSLEIPHTYIDDSSFSENSSIDETMNDSTANYGTRPPVPDIDASKYQGVLSLFYCMTEENPDSRPPASDIVQCVEDLFNTN